MIKNWLFAASAALGASVAAQAEEPDQLGCIAETYTEQQKVEIDTLLPKLDVLFQTQPPSFVQLAQIITGVARTCAQANGWQLGKRDSASEHELGRIMELTLRQHGVLTPEDFDRIDALLVMGDRTRLWKVMEKHLRSGMTGSDERILPAEAQVMGSFLVETGLAPDQRKLDQVSVYLSAKTMQRITARDFAAQ
ncbi:MAG: hypothetical protein AAF687_11255 [Pseudomonadota bacterium]